MTIYAIHLLHMSVVGNHKNEMSNDSPSSVLARRNNVSSYTIICQSPFPSVFYRVCSFMSHFTFLIFTLSNTFTTYVSLNTPFLSEFLFCLSLRIILARQSIFSWTNFGQTSLALLNCDTSQIQRKSLFCQTVPSVLSCCLVCAWPLLVEAVEALLNAIANMNSSCSTNAQEKFSSLTLFT